MLPDLSVDQTNARARFEGRSAQDRRRNAELRRVRLRGVDAEAMRVRAIRDRSLVHSAAATDATETPGVAELVGA